ncbi:hypothetical protein SCA6_015906 [Theobroma cacao]
MASPTAKIAFRTVIGVLLLLALFYVGRPLYWKISATVHDIRHNKQTIMHEAQKSVGWFHDESDSGFREDRKQASRRLLFKKEVSDYQQHQKNLLCSFIFIKHFKLQDLSTTIGKPYLDSSEQSHIHRFNVCQLKLYS